MALHAPSPALQEPQSRSRTKHSGSCSQPRSEGVRDGEGGAPTGVRWGLPPSRSQGSCCRWEAGTQLLCKGNPAEPRNQLGQCPREGHRALGWTIGWICSLVSMVTAGGGIFTDFLVNEVVSMKHPSLCAICLLPIDRDIFSAFKS